MLQVLVLFLFQYYYPRAALTMDCSTRSVTVTEEQTWASSRVYNSGSRILFTWQMPAGFG